MWDRRYASRAVNLLVIFAEKGFRYTISNCPMNSLYKIFCLWYPQNCFTFEEQKILIQNVIENNHSIAAELVNQLLPGSRATTLNISKPKWRLVECKPRTVYMAELTEMTQFITAVHLDNITPTVRDWEPVLQNLELFKPVENLVERCQQLVPYMPENDVFSLCAKIARYISNSRSYHHDKEERMRLSDVMESLLFSILPDSPRSYTVFFSDNFKGLVPYRYKENKYDYDEEQRCLREFHKEKMHELLLQYGKDAIIQNASYIENLRAYGVAIATVVMQSNCDWTFIKQLRAVSPALASYVIEELYWISGLDLLISAEDRPEKEDLGWALSCIQLKEDIAEFVENSGDGACQRAYWERVSIWGLQREDKASVDKYVRILLKYNRPFTLIDYLAYSKWDTAELIIQILEAALKLYPGAEPNGLTLERVGSSDIEKMFEKLYSQSGLPELEIARLELAYLRAFDHQFEPQFLVDQVLQQPTLYMELLMTAYRADDDRGEAPSQANPHAGQAFEALDRIRRIPGYDTENKVMDSTKFQKWYANVIELAKSSGYTLANDIVLGQILSFAPVGKDGIWPTECVRQVFETSASEALERHFIIGKHNQRGVYNVTGGRGEDKLADKYAAIADKLQILYPRTSAIIRRISEDYRVEAKQERARELKGFT